MDDRCAGALHCTGSPALCTVWELEHCGGSGRSRWRRRCLLAPSRGGRGVTGDGASTVRGGGKGFASDRRAE